MPLLPLPNSTEFGNLLADRQCVAYGVVALFSLACGVFVGATSKDLLQYIQTLPSGRGWILLVISSVPAIILSSILSVCGKSPFKRFSETRHLSASNFAAACGIHPYISRKELYLLMKGELKLEETSYAQNAKDWGISNEAKAFMIYSHLQSHVRVDRPTTLFRHRKLNWLVGIPDGIIFDKDDVCGLLEIKCRYHENPEQIVPHQTLSSIYYYIPQIQGYLEICDLDYCDLMSYTPKGSNLFRIWRNPRYWSKMRVLLKDFWNCYQGNTVPSCNHPLSNELKQMSLAIEWETIDLYSF